MRTALFAAFLVLAACAPKAPAPAFTPQAAFLNHTYAVLDAQTADAITHSEYLQHFGALAIRTTTANSGETWTGRYLTGRQTYFEIFGPHDDPDPVGSAGLALSPDQVGGLAMVSQRLVEEGVTHPDTAQRTRRFGSDQIPWFNTVSPPGNPDAFAPWAMEYLPSYMNDPRAQKEPAAGPDDVISRERYQPDDYKARLMRDITGVEIAATAHDIDMAKPLFAAAGFAVARDAAGLRASDRDTTITLDEVTRAQTGMRKLTFVLNAPVTETHIEGGLNGSTQHIR